MVRSKIEIKKIEKESSRHATYVKRRSGVFKKARELATLCECEVAVILLSANGEVDHHCSSDLIGVITRYRNCLTRYTPAHKPEESNMQVEVLRQETQKHNIKKLQLLGKKLTGMDLQELHALEKKLNEGLLCIKDRKEQILLVELAQCKRQEQQAILEIENLSRQVEGFRSFFKSTSSMPVSVNYHPGTTSTVKPADKDSDTTLCLGLPFSGGR